MPKNRILMLMVLGAIIFFYGCGSPPSPIDEIKSALKGVPTYSVILEDMTVEGNFFKDYYHKYRVIVESQTTETGWRRVSEKFHKKYEPFLGMTIWSKKDGKESGTAGPPGYEYVGDSRYGKWQSDSSGRSFWAFYGQYRLMSDLLGMGGPIYRNNYGTYQQYRTKGQPYYGPRNEYGTRGSVTKKQKPNFYARRMQRERAKRSSFSDKVNRRVGRSRANARGRSRGWGK